MATWADKYKEEQFLVCRDEGHNKIWSASYDEQTGRVVVKWGRLGTKGSSQVKDFGRDKWGARRFIEGKFREKNAKGYEPCDKATFDRLSIESAIVGTSNKFVNLGWVNIEGQHAMRVTDAELMDSAMNPGMLLEIELRKTGLKYLVVITLDTVYEAIGAREFTLNPVGYNHPELKDIMQKVEEAIGRGMNM